MRTCLFLCTIAGTITILLFYPLLDASHSTLLGDFSSNLACDELAYLQKTLEEAVIEETGSGEVKCVIGDEASPRSLTLFYRLSIIELLLGYDDNVGLRVRNVIDETSKKYSIL